MVPSLIKMFPAVAIAAALMSAELDSWIELPEVDRLPRAQLGRLRVAPPEVDKTVPVGGLPMPTPSRQVWPSIGNAAIALVVTLTVSICGPQIAVTRLAKVVFN